MPILDTLVEIDAPAEAVWEVLTDFPRWSEWNPAIPSLAGELRVGSDLAIQLDLSGRAMNVAATIQELVPGERFSWRGHLGAEFLFLGRREFSVESLEPDTSRLRHVEAISGLIAPVFQLAKGKAVTEHHHLINAALKQRAEELATRS
jgi:hypothetical protein